jgi:CBS-domain-containing membrane protein
MYNGAQRVEKSMTVKDIMTEDVVTVRPNDAITEAAKLLYKHSITGLPVVDKKNKLVGIITEADFLLKAGREKVHVPFLASLLRTMKFSKQAKRAFRGDFKAIVKAKVSDVMTKNPATVTPDITVEKAIEISATKGKDPLVVIDDKGVVVGIISRADLVKWLYVKNTKWRVYGKK